jgi:hypothetical protein
MSSWLAIPSIAWNAASCSGDVKATTLIGEDSAIPSNVAASVLMTDSRALASA